MKKMLFLAMMMTIAISASAMTYNEARNEALFLSDKMAYELNLTEAQYDAVYRINLDYLMSISGRDPLGIWWDRRNADLRYVLDAIQYNRYLRINYFYRPLSWYNGAWVFHVRGHYGNHGRFFRPRPAAFASYRGHGPGFARPHVGAPRPITGHVDRLPGAHGHRPAPGHGHPSHGPHNGMHHGNHR